MAQYVVQERSFINGRIHEAGELVEHSFTDGGTHGANLKPAHEAEADRVAANAAAPILKVKIIPPATGGRPQAPAQTPPPASGGRPADDASDLVS